MHELNKKGITSICGCVEVLIKILVLSPPRLFVSKPILKYSGLICTRDLETAELIKTDRQKGANSTEFMDCSLIVSCLDIGLSYEENTCYPWGLK